MPQGLLPAGQMSCVVPQKPSLPVVAQPLIRAGARLPLVTTSVYGPPATVTCAVPSAPVVAAAVPPWTVAPADGANAVSCPRSSESKVVTASASP